MEDIGKLDPSNELQVHLLQYCFLLLYNKNLETWRSGWNRHQIRTANNRTPLQMYLSQPHASDLDEEVNTLANYVALIAAYCLS